MKYTFLDGTGNVLNCNYDNAAVIRDNQTELDWEIKSLNPNDKRFAKNVMTWQEFTKDYIEYLNGISYGGFNDWRVPSKHELRSLINYNNIAPAFAQDVFKTLQAADYWCGDKFYAQRPDCGWVINFNIGATTAKNQSNLSCGVAVRGKSLPPAAERFIDNGDGTITDKVTKLMWQKEANPRTSYSQVMAMLPNFELAGYKDWRLPTMHELSSIFDDSYSDNNWFFGDYFDSNEIPHYITSNIFQDTFVWVINFYFGYDGYYAEKNIGLGYRLVREVHDNATFKMPSGGQIEIFNAEGVVIGKDDSRGSCSFSEFDEYIVDNKTGIAYEKATDKVYTYAEAVEHVKKLNAENYGGKNNWRLPIVDELRFIADYSKKNPAVFDDFADFVKADCYWTGEKYNTPNGDRNWTIYFGYGCAVPIEKAHACGCIAISGGYENLADKSLERYEIKDGVVIDKYTKLMWLQDELPDMTYGEFTKYLAENTLAGYNDWRVPDMKEMSTLVIREAENNAWFNEKLFPNIFAKPRNFFIVTESFNGMFCWGANMTFAYDGYYANRLVGKYRIKPVRNL